MEGWKGGDEGWKLYSGEDTEGWRVEGGDGGVRVDGRWVEEVMGPAKLNIRKNIFHTTSARDCRGRPPHIFKWRHRSW